MHFSTKLIRGNIFQSEVILLQSVWLEIFLILICLFPSLKFYVWLMDVLIDWFSKHLWNIYFASSTSQQDKSALLIMWYAHMKHGRGCSSILIVHNLSHLVSLCIWLINISIILPPGQGHHQKWDSICKNHKECYINYSFL